MKPELLLTNIAPEIFDGRPIMIKSKYAGTVKGTIAVEKKDSGMLVLAQYEASPFPDIPKPSNFYLTQKQLDEYLGNPASCILHPPEG